MHRHDISHRFLEMIIDSPPHAYRPDDRCEIIIEQNQRGRFASNVCPATTHRDPYVGGLQGGSIVYSITRHRDDFTIRLQCIDESQFLFWNHSRKYIDGSHSLLKLGVVELL